jgi:hypothetical protein
MEWTHPVITGLIWAMINARQHYLAHRHFG